MKEIILEVIERDGRKLFYCPSEDFATNILSADMLGYATATIKVLFDGVEFTRYYLSEVGTHGAMMLFTQSRNYFSIGAFYKKLLLARNFAIGDELRIEIEFMQERFEVTFTQAIKEMYIMFGYEKKFYLDAKEITLREWCDRLKEGIFSECRYFILGERISRDQLGPDARSKIYSAEGTGIKSLDTAKKIIFRRYSNEKIV